MHFIASQKQKTKTKKMVSDWRFPPDAAGGTYDAPLDQSSQTPQSSVEGASPLPKVPNLPSRRLRCLDQRTFSAQSGRATSIFSTGQRLWALFLLSVMRFSVSSHILALMVINLKKIKLKTTAGLMVIFFSSIFWIVCLMASILVLLSIGSNAILSV